MPEGDIYLERRKHKRVMKKMHVSYKVMSGDEFEQPPPDIERKRKVNSEDISITGMQLICDEELKMETIIRLDINVEGESTPLATFAEVRWIRHDKQLNKYRIGMEFLVIKEDHINVIKKITGE